jgi:hypothetical protein
MVACVERRFGATKAPQPGGAKLGENVHDKHPIAKVGGASTKPGWVLTVGTVMAIGMR